MSNDTKFLNGLIVKAPKELAPDFIKFRLSIKREELIATLQSMNGEWVNADVKESRDGKLYCQVDDWKPEPGRGGGRGGSRGGAPQRQRPAPAAVPADDFEDDDIPFIRQRSTW